MAVEIPVFFLLAFYLEAVFPSEFGVKKAWHFPVTDLIQLYKDRNTLKSVGGLRKSEAELATSIQINEDELQFEDLDVKQERKRIFAPEFKYDDHTLVLKNMRKVYGGRGGAGPKLAVKDVTLAIERGVTFGLLGPNGAGKTTLISILTGLYPASAGHATIAGYDIQLETEKVYKTLGICPQFDIQWDELTVGEHMYFYARLKGIVPEDERYAIEKALGEVSLAAFEHRLTKGLSGGSLY
jgi:ABC-type glutathione transport system ATPase component